MSLPACGIYRTTAAIGEVPPGTFVYFHNHGSPGPGIYQAEAWAHNRAQFSKRGTTLPDDKSAEKLAPLAAEGLYRVTEEFTCCGKACRTYRPGTLVQLGYNRKGEGILFLPTMAKAGLTLPERGTKIEDDRTAKLERLIVAQEQDVDGPASGAAIH